MNAVICHSNFPVSCPCKIHVQLFSYFTVYLIQLFRLPADSFLIYPGSPLYRRRGNQPDFHFPVINFQLLNQYLKKFFHTIPCIFCGKSLLCQKIVCPQHNPYSYRPFDFTPVSKLFTEKVNLRRIIRDTASVYSMILYEPPGFLLKNTCPADIFRIPSPCQRLRIISVGIRVPITYDCSLHFSLFLSLRLHTQ